MNTSLIPALDPTPIPGPAWLFHVLLVFTFFLHLLFMNLALGGTLLAAIAQALAGRDASDPKAVLARRLMGINTYGISFAITTGIAPLLFVQVLYQQYFYTATILIGWAWFGFLISLTVGYYAVYVYKFKAVPQGGGSFWLLLAAVLFLLIAMVHVAVNLIHSRPETWTDVAASPWSVLADPAYWVRLFHFVPAAIGFSALVVAWWAVRQAKAGLDVELNTGIARFAWAWALVTAIVQVVDGFALLFVVPRHALKAMMSGGAGTLVPLGVSVLLGLGILVMLSRVRNPVDSPGLVSGTLMTTVLAIAVMSITRHQVRELSLAPATADTTIATAPQWGNFVLFAVLLVAGLFTVFYMVRGVLTQEAAGAEAA